MTIEKNINGTAAELKIVGRLDTTTAPELEAAIDGCVAGLTELVLDCSALEYVSSAAKTNRKKLTGAYSDKSPLKTVVSMDQDIQMAVYTSDGRCVIFSTAQLLPKTTRNTQGVAVVSLKKKAVVTYAVAADASGVTNHSRYRTRTLPSAGALLKEEDSSEKQIQFEV